MTPTSSDEALTLALLLGAEFKRTGTGGRTSFWMCAADGGSSPLYVQKGDAALGYLRRRGYEINFVGDLVEVIK